LSSGGAAPQSTDNPTRIAAIDIGSNSIRQIIADVSPDGSIRVIDEMKAAPRLGAGIEKSGRLSEIAIQNALATLGRMAALAKQLGARRTEVIATSAVRGATNSQRFLDLVREETGLRVKIVDGEDGAFAALSRISTSELDAPQSSTSAADRSSSRSALTDSSSDCCRSRSAQSE